MVPLQLGYWDMPLFASCTQTKVVPASVTGVAVSSGACNAVMVARANVAVVCI